MCQPSLKLHLIVLKFHFRRGRLWRKCSKITNGIANINWENVTDSFMDPIIWVVDNFSGTLGIVSHVKQAKYLIRFYTILVVGVV